MILLVKFAESRGVNPDTVATYIRRHPEVFSGHTQQQGNKLLLDDDAVKILDEKYPLPKPVEIINGVDPTLYQNALERLEKAKDLVIQLKDAKSQLELDLAKKESEQLLLEEKMNLETEKMQIKVDHLEAEKNQMETQYLDEISRLQQELQKEKSRKLSFMERLKGRKGD